MALRRPYERLEKLWNEDIYTVAGGMRKSGQDKLRHEGHCANMGRAREGEIVYTDRATGTERYEFLPLPPGDFPFPVMMVSHRYWSENLRGINADLAFNSLNCSSTDFDFHLSVEPKNTRGPDRVFVGVHGHAVAPILSEGMRESARCNREDGRKGLTTDLIYASPDEDNAFESYASRTHIRSL